jgi:hypothetical protein
MQERCGVNEILETFEDLFESADEDFLCHHSWDVASLLKMARPPWPDERKRLNREGVRRLLGVAWCSSRQFGDDDE